MNLHAQKRTEPSFVLVIFVPILIGALILAYITICSLSKNDKSDYTDAGKYEYYKTDESFSFYYPADCFVTKTVTNGEAQGYHIVKENSNGENDIFVISLKNYEQEIMDADGKKLSAPESIIYAYTKDTCFNISTFSSEYDDGKLVYRGSGSCANNGNGYQIEAYLYTQSTQERDYILVYGPPGMTLDSVKGSLHY